MNIPQPSSINHLLSTWDPIGVDFPESEIEYTSYVPSILRCLHQGTSLDDCLLAMLDAMGLGARYRTPKGKERVAEAARNIQALSEAGKRT